MTDLDLDEPRDDAQEQYGNISRPLEEWERPSEEVVAALKRLSDATPPDKFERGGGDN